MPKNPPWTRDELILALDLYFRANPLHISKKEKDPRIIDLSELLNRLPLHPRRTEYETFRNASGVYMKLCNFLRLDPSYAGEGLKRGGKLEEQIWVEYSSDLSLLKLTAAAISRGSELFETPKARLEAEFGLGDDEFPEGRIITMSHKRKERNRIAVKKKKEQVLRATGRLACEVCRFEFAQFYGEPGAGIIECHHNKPLAESVLQRNTRLSDLSLVCANCHRVLHKTRPWISVTQLRESIGRREAHV